MEALPSLMKLASLAVTPIVCCGYLGNLDRLHAKMVTW